MDRVLLRHLLIPAHSAGSQTLSHWLPRPHPSLFPTECCLGAHFLPAGFSLSLYLAFPQPTSPEEQFEQQPVHFTIGSQEMSLETPPPTTAPQVAPVPKPRTFQPGKGIERRPSSGKTALGEAPPVTGATELPPPEAPTLAPKVPPRRKKSAPAAFHLQVLQSNSQLLQGLPCPPPQPDACPPCLQPDAYPPCPQPDAYPPCPQPDAYPPCPPAAALLGVSSAASPETDEPRVAEPEVAAFHGDDPDPFWSLLHHPKLLNHTWLPRSSDPLDLGSRNSERTHTDPAQVSASVAERGLPPDRGGKDFSHWVAASNKDKRTTLGV